MPFITSALWMLYASSSKKGREYISGTKGGKSHIKAPEYTNPHSSRQQTIHLAKNFHNILKPAPILQAQPPPPPARRLRCYH